MGGRGSASNRWKASTEQRERRMSGGGGGDAAGIARGKAGGGDGGLNDFPVEFNDGFTVRWAPLTKENAKRVFGREMSDREIGRVVGAPDGATIGVQTHPFDNDTIVVEVFHPQYVGAQSRAFSRNRRGDLEVYNEYFEVDGDAPRGVGTGVFANQVANLRRNGAKKIFTTAARNDDPDMFYNGYYVWALMGYNFKFEPYHVRKLPRKLRDAQTVQDLMKTQRGRDWWKKNGWEFKGEFDLTDDSVSMRALDAYLKRAKWKVPFNL